MIDLTKFTEEELLIIEKLIESSLKTKIEIHERLNHSRYRSEDRKREIDKLFILKVKILDFKGAQ